jgi:hypothetical protein
LQRWVLGQQYENFLSDYSQYQMFLAFWCWNAPSSYCNDGSFVFNKTTIETDDLVQLLQNDPRVRNASEEVYWRPRVLAIELVSNVNESEFIENYSEYNFGGSYYNDNYYGGRPCFSFNDTQVYTGDFMDILRADQRVNAVDPVPGWAINSLCVALENWVVGSIAGPELITEFSQYEMVGIEFFPRFNIWIFEVDFNMFGEFNVMNALNDDFRVRTAYPNVLYRHIYCPGDDNMPIEDDYIIPLGSITVYPNPVISGDVCFSINSHLKTRSSHETKISIYNVKGQLVKEKLIEESTFVWNKKDNNNQDVAQGVYFYQVKSDKDTFTGKILILK